MTGPEHYREAEEKLKFARRIADPESGHSDEDAMRLIGIALQRAQVHATLALAAATALSNATVRLPDWNAWRDTAGTQPAAAS